MLDRLRSRLEGYLTLVGREFAGLETSPTAWTIVGLIVSLVAGLSYSTGRYSGGLVGGVVLLVSGWFDIVDGAVARITGRTSKRGAFLDSTLDRVAEVAVYVGILAGGYAAPLGLQAPVLVAIAMAVSLLVSYTRAKGDSLGVSLSGVGIGERSERLIILAVASIVGLVGWGVLLVAIVASYTFIERVYRATRALT